MKSIVEINSEPSRQLALELFMQSWNQRAWEYQKQLFESRHELYRNFVVERQAGTTYGLTADAITMALETERLQVIVAANQLQALIYKHYLKVLVSELFSEQLEKWLLKNFRFVAPVQLAKALIGQSAWDVYVTDYLWLSNGAVSQVLRQVKCQAPVRQTWVTTLPNDAKYQLLVKASPV